MVRDERGQATPVLAMSLVALLVVVGLVLALVGAASDRAAAQAAADAAALAGAAEGPDAAERLAAANGAELVSFEDLGGVVEVKVRVGSSAAVARAELFLRPSRPS